MLKQWLTLAQVAVLSFACAAPNAYQRVAMRYGVNANHLYATALQNASVRNAYGQAYPWAWSLRMDGNAYQFKSRGELFQFLQSVNALQHNITYGIANLPYLRTLTPQQLWQSLDFNYQLNQLGKRLQPRQRLVRQRLPVRQRVAHHGKVARTPANIQRIIRRVSREVGIEKALLQAVIAQESAYRVRAVSSAGAQGLMQLMPATAKHLGLKSYEVFDPYKNIRAGARYLKQLLKQFNGRLDWALAAYNAGPNAVKRYGGIPPYKETRAYVPKVLRYYRQYQRGGS